MAPRAHSVCQLWVFGGVVDILHHLAPRRGTPGADYNVASGVEFDVIVVATAAWYLDNEQWWRPQRRVHNPPHAQAVD